MRRTVLATDGHESIFEYGIGRIIIELILL